MASDLVRLPRYAPGSPEWETQRELAVGGSEIGAVLGISPYDSAFGLWHRKKRLAPPVEENDAMWWGNVLEQPIATRFRFNHPEFARIERTGTFQRADIPALLVSPDRAVFESPRNRVPLEIKKARHDDDWGRGEEDVPPHYHAQHIVQMGLWGVDHGWFAVLIGGVDYREYRIGFDQPTFDLIVERAAAFVQSLIDNVRPDIDSSAATYEVIKWMHPDIVDRVEQLPDDLVYRYLATLELEEQAKIERQYATSLIADAMGDAKTAMHGKTVIARRQARGDGVPYVVKGRSLPTAADYATGIAAVYERRLSEIDPIDESTRQAVIDAILDPIEETIA